jgi:hypothetical protein
MRLKEEEEEKDKKIRDEMYVYYVILSLHFSENCHFTETDFIILTGI